ncbi:hypothetical protein JCM19294_76 [Nonlabens tegetincola]|uniref:Uncharacterized protein n=2 Tax=Nonlabens tegetincola TaxID=323273 RepID=A0A090Q3J4_9FLAO|nr:MULTISPECIES: CIA30 family protein [Nonlabens]ALM19780.1 hypothetical protein AAT17_00155 [Nonlabens sp. MIC269]ARN71214.1 hypothetical protein BST91_05910 [Nonlabens tegetincola]GAK97540.1 hypothetical protein JCM19294_76 [Nonlabens tegetincola]
MKTLEPLIPTEIKFGRNMEYRFKWTPLTDSLTGGKSTGKIIQHDHYVEFCGTIKSVNNSSWSMLRSHKLEQDLSEVKFIEIKLRTDGRPVAFEIEFNPGVQQEKYGYMIRMHKNTWKTIKLPINHFKRVLFHNIIPGEIDKENLKKVLRYNFYISDGIVGDYSIDVEYIKFL